ncbi:DEAD-box ATP-dependent RNA helicase 39 [Coffea eugenioides]|uniref:DEAD-box ATP-dependent RNA helicase 39 n=1 Tax=Coffea eugenioides TaxID=49369 RepID=UPI000F60F7A5|nr:DEAD-box ATP-dependent RNA helicase 39 [Coffea eugenioides]
MSGTGKVLLSLSLASPSTTRFSFSLLSSTKRFSLYKPLFPLLQSSANRVFVGFRPLCSATTITAPKSEDSLQPIKHSVLLERLRVRHLKDSAKLASPEVQSKKLKAESLGAKTGSGVNEGISKRNKRKNEALASNFEELGLSEEVMGALEELSISVPTEIQCIGIPAVLAGKSVVLGSHTGSGKTLAYMLPLVQLLRRDEALNGILMRPRRPRAVVLCPTRELCEQVYRVAKSISHHARFRSTMVSGGGRLRPQEDSLNTPMDLVVGTPGRVLQHIEEGNMVYGDIRYLVLDEADTMFDRGFGPDIRKFLGPLKNRASKHDGLGFQTVLVSATMTKAVQKLVDEEFQGIVHLHTSTLHKKIASARHDFIKLSGSENKLEALLQVLEPSLSKGNRVMVFCNTLNSSRAVDHFLHENGISTVNYHGEVPAEERVENLEKFKSEDGDCPTLVCTDLAARGLDLDVDHVIMFDFPLTSIDYLHRTGRTARMGAKGKVTSLVAKKDQILATRIEEAILKNESLESLSVGSVQRDIARARINEQKGKSVKLLKASKHKKTATVASAKSSGADSKAKPKKGLSKNGAGGKVDLTKRTSRTSPGSKSVTATAKVCKNFSGANSLKAKVSHKEFQGRKPDVSSSRSKLNVVGFRGRSSSSSQPEGPCVF